MARCFWAAGNERMVAYHDEEWGRPVADDVRLFEKLSLEAFQSGLSWRTILDKRDNFRRAFAGFDFRELAAWGEPDVQRLLGDAGIVRHRGKIEAVLHNAGRAVELVEEEGSLAAFVWSFAPPASERPERLTEEVLYTLGSSEASKRLSKALKKRGWKFVGPTTAYAFMQSMGLVNDHVEGCFCRAEVAAELRGFAIPKR